MGDEYYHIIPRPKNNPIDYNFVYNNFLKILGNYNIENMSMLTGPKFGINPFDLYFLKCFIEENKIKHVLELGAGTSTLFLDKLGIKRKSYALESIYYDINFEQIDLYLKHEIVEDYIRKNDIDLFLIDCEHSYNMGKLISEKFFSIKNYKIPFFVHDWFDFNKYTYGEQKYYIENMLEFFNVFYMSDLPEEYIKKLKEYNTQIDNDELYQKFGLKIEHLPIIRCSALLIPK